MTDTITQQQLLRKHFDAGLTLTRLEAHLKYGIGNVTARLTDIRAAGYGVKTTMVKVKNMRGKYVRIAVWSKLQ